jgi:hypothetical protein
MILKPLALFDMESQLTVFKRSCVAVRPKAFFAQYTWKIVDMKFISDEKSAVKNSAMLDRSIENGLDFVRVLKCKKSIHKGECRWIESDNTDQFPEMVLSRIDGYFFVNTLN